LTRSFALLAVVAAAAVVPGHRRRRRRGRRGDQDRHGLLFLCLVPSTVQSSIAFTSIAHGNVPAAIVSASLSNMLGVVLTPLLVVLLMQTSGGPQIDASAVLDIALQLLLPFVAAGGTSRLRGTSAAVARQMGAPAPGCHEGVRSRLDADRRLHGVLDEHGRARVEHGARSSCSSAQSSRPECRGRCRWISCG
jgi:hypothetical protein